MIPCGTSRGVVIFPIAGKVLSGKFQTECLRLLAGQSILQSILRIKADDVMVRFDLAEFLVFLPLTIRQLALLIERGRIAVQAIHVKFLSGNHMPQLITDRFAGCLAMLLPS